LPRESRISRANTSLMMVMVFVPPVWLVSYIEACACVQLSAVSRQPSAVSHQPSAISHQPSAISHQPSA
ncbi:MAG: hypothetical protein ACOY35_02290, partial [Bacillota bacterium]